MPPTHYVGAINAIEAGLQGLHCARSVTGSPLAGKLFVVIGVSGAGKALAYGAKEKRERVVIANCTYERARELDAAVGVEALSLANLGDFHPESGMVLANTTSIGIHPKVDETPLSKGFWRLDHDAAPGDLFSVWLSHKALALKNG